MKDYNCKGQLVYTAGFSQLKAGKNILSWNGQDSKKKHCSAGVYLIKLQSKTGSAVQKVLLMK
jgi:flagellar hook assembly protein FlgD